MVRVSPRNARSTPSRQSLILAVLLASTLAFCTQFGHREWLFAIEAQTTSSVVDDDNDQCRFYLAESAIPQSGLGVFTAVDLKKGDEAQSLPDICIYVVDTPHGTPFDTHSWSRDIFNARYEGERPRAACEGFATLFNTMPDHVKTSELLPMRAKSNAGLKRTDSPGAGAITQYYGTTSVAVRDIQGGSELTINYGDWSFKSNREYKAPLRTPEWLRRHGWCIDYIDIRPSLIDGAGRGAFAKRSLPKGAVVAPAPVQFFPDRSVFDGKPTSVFVNYCFEVPSTDILLYPYGPGVGLINHSRQPNIGVRWSTAPLAHHPWLDLPLPQFQQMIYPGGIVLEYVALREIAADEELTMDYGATWDAAWQSHVSQWTPPPAAAKHVYPADMDLTQPFRTLTEQKKEPYAKNLQTICRTPKWSRSQGPMAWYEPDHPWPKSNIRCHILERTQDDAGNYVYEVALDWTDDELDENLPREELYIDTGVPHSAIGFVEKKYTSDMNLPNGFRHAMELPPHLIPPTWLSKS